jgi:glycosyltransferase involved in cell wall biosynthesis
MLHIPAEDEIDICIHRNRMKLSVCIPCFNGRSTIEETFRSVTAQTVRPFEFLVADNGSSDGSREVIERLVDENPDSGVVAHYFDSPLGMAADWNRLVHLATGDLVLVLACDDLLESTAMETHLTAFKSRDVALSSSPKRLLSSRSRTFPLCLRRLPPGHFVRQDILRLAVPRADNIIGEPSGVAFRRKDFITAGGFDETLKYFPDLDLWFRLLAYGGIIVNHKALYRFRVHSGSLTSVNQQRALAEWETVYARHAAAGGLPPAPGAKDAVRAIMTLGARRIVMSILHFF